MANIIEVYHRGGSDLPDTIPVDNVKTLMERLQENLINPTTVDKDFIFEFNILQETNLKEGNLVYIFKPFRNMRAGTDILDNSGNIITQQGEIIDFSTKDLNFSINNPIDISVQPSYDGTVNLILTDDLNPPRLINSRFSATEGKRYFVVDRSGNKDTNLYDQFLIERQTKLYKTINKVPNIELNKVRHDGALPVGNYVFYFKFADADDNETDIIAESGIVSCFIGGINDPLTMRGGMADENSGKSIIFNITNIDSSYNFLIVYYSRSTSGYSEQEITSYHKIDTKFTIKAEDSEYRITGYENTSTITEDQINIQYNIVDKNASATQVQNRLFMANVHKATFPFEDLKDLSFRILPYPVQNPDVSKSLGFLDSNYIPLASANLDIDPAKCMYYNTDNIYNFIGYWDEEIYRFAIVYILNDYSLSDPFNIRGLDFTVTNQYTIGAIGTEYSMWTDTTKTKRQYLTNREDGFFDIGSSKNTLENLRGTIKIGGLNSQIADNKINPIGIQFVIDNDVQAELEKYTKGFFIVRQKRIPTIISQGITIGHDSISGLPLIPEFVSNQINHVIQGIAIFKTPYTGVDVSSYSDITASLAYSPPPGRQYYRLPKKGESFFTFVNENMIDPSDDSIIFSALKDRVRPGSAMIVPDLILDSENLNNTFTGAEFTLTTTNYIGFSSGFTRAIQINNFPQNTSTEKLDQLSTNFVIENYKSNPDKRIDKATLVAVSEGTPAISFNNTYFSSRAGIPEEAWRFSAFLKEEFGLVNVNVSYNGVGYTPEQNVLLRGIFMPYVGMIPVKDNPSLASGIFYNIRILGYSNTKDTTESYFKIRFNDNSPFTSITGRLSWETFNQKSTNLLTSRGLEAYRGDCFINQVTIRVLRNFADASLPTNDTIIDPDTLSTDFPGYANISGLVLDDTDNEDVLKIKRSDVNAARVGYWVTFKFCSNINYAFRCIDPTFVSEYALFGRPRAFFPLYDKNLGGSNKIAESTVMNVGYNSTTSDKKYYVSPEVPAIKNDFSNRVMYSEIHVNDAFKNGYRLFQGQDYKDYTLEYGSITKIVGWLNNLIIVFETGVGVLPVNERTMAGSAEGENVYLRGAGVLPEKPLMISQGIGSAWKDSVQVSQNYIYGVDTAAKKIWRTDGQKFDTFSDFRIQKYLHDNITFTVYDRIPTIGLKNVVTHFNVHKYDLMFTFYDQSQNNQDVVWNICYNEHLNNWTTRYTWVPSFTANANNTMFSFARGTCKVTSMISKSLSGTDGIGSIYIDSDQENPLTLNDYLALFYEVDLSQGLTPIISGKSILTVGNYSFIPKGQAYEFMDNQANVSHPMAIGGNYTAGYDKTYVFECPTDCILVTYGLANNQFLLSVNSRLEFYTSDNILQDLTYDTLVDTKYNLDGMSSYIITTATQPFLKIRFIVGSTADEAEANKLAKEGWSFNIMAIPFVNNTIKLTDYLLTLAGKEKYKGTPTFKYTFEDTPAGKTYDNNLFEMSPDSSLHKFTIKPEVFYNYCAAEKYEYIKTILSQIYFSLWINVRVTFNTTTSSIVGYDELEDILFIRPSEEALTQLLDRFTNGPVPILKPATFSCPLTEFTQDQIEEIKGILTKTIALYKANTTTNLWKHGTNKIFGYDTISKPANWYGEQHPFEFEFIVNGDEIGIHKLFDNLKIISNKAEPASFEYEIVGDSYEFTKDYQEGRTNPNYIFNNETYLKDGYALVPPAVTTTYPKTSEHRILSVQPAKDIKKVGLRQGNMQYKEDMWEVQISPFRVEKTDPITKATKVVESKIRDKYCKIRVKYTGEQVAIITALNTLYTLSYS